MSEEIAAIVASMHKLHELGMITILEERPDGAVRYRLGPILDRYMLETGCPIPEMMSRFKRAFPLRHDREAFTAIMFAPYERVTV